MKKDKLSSILTTASCLLLIGLLFTSCQSSSKPKEPLPAPELSLRPGIYSSQQNLEISCSVANAMIYYTTDGSEPTKNSLLYTQPLIIRTTTTVKTKAYKEGRLPSPITEATYSFLVGSLYFSHEGCLSNEPLIVKIYAVTTGAKIYYTFDGSEPDTTDFMYTEPLLLDGNTILSARGFIAGWEPSQTITANFIFQVKNIVFSYSTGIYYHDFQLDMSTETPSAKIHYTIDGSEPVQTSPLYSSPLNIDVSCIVKAKAFKDNWLAGDTTTESYTLKVIAPQFNPLPGYYNNEQTVKIFSSTPNAQIYYTTDGLSPTSESALYMAPIPVDQNIVLAAVVCRKGWTDSNIASGRYNFTVQSPVINPNGGTYNKPQTISISCSTPNSEIHYTLDGSNPSLASQIYTKPFTIEASCIIKAKAYRNNWYASPVTTAQFTIIIIQQVASPLFSPPTGSYNESQFVTISCPTEGAVIRFTDDLTEPAQNSMLYTSPILIHQTTTLKTKAFKTGWQSSETASATYDIIHEHQALVYVEGGTFNMGCHNPEGDIDEYPVHSVTLSSFYISPHEVTQGEYFTVMNINPSYFNLGEHYPVDTISYYDAIVYCNRRSMLEGLPPCYEYSGYGFETDLWPEGWNTYYNNNIICHFEFNSYRLPTEAEWEFAARGGIYSNNYIYSGSNNLDLVGWFNYNSSGQSHPVAQLNPNELNLYDMSGNMWELVWDFYGPYSSESEIDPHGPETGTNVVFRSGMWYGSASYSRVSNRSYAPPYALATTYGFRVVRTSY
ncbi:MAG TPA: chitobiase/beta-hexosaminidase C-terminal domain-containing protein [Candidatus Cloacimonadota bacterium]|nr:chitobiase/beta-hexosaminidase C-terminal domain-containing protein [Candidatus Cloacimonadota bacterium]HQL14314.1 chitobiase/beta-hexosaminidase C-terminal domain-containing protein [Candidatus Cloacimonadota bacterium]